MAEERCVKCNETLGDAALTCWACGTLTEAGRKAKRLPEDEDETWRRSVEAAKARQKEKPAVDPDEALRQVVAQAGTEEQLQRVTRPAPAHDDTRSDYAKLRGTARTMASMGLLLAVLFALAGLLTVVLALMALSGVSGGAAFLLALTGLLVLGTAAIAVYLIFRHLSHLSLVVADAGDNARRAVLLMRERTPQSADQAERPS